MRINTLKHHKNCLANLGKLRFQAGSFCAAAAVFGFGTKSTAQRPCSQSKHGCFRPREERSYLKIILKNALIFHSKSSQHHLFMQVFRNFKV